MRRGGFAEGGCARRALLACTWLFGAAVLAQVLLPSERWLPSVSGRGLIAGPGAAGWGSVGAAQETLPGSGTVPSARHRGSQADDATGRNTFYIYPGAIFGADVQPLWRPVSAVQPEMSCFVDTLEGHRNRTRRPEEADLFVVPLYELSHIVYGKNTNMSEIQGALTTLRQNLNATKWYVKYGGSNHVFVFPVRLPQHIMRVAIDVLDLGLYSYWAGSSLVGTFLNWKCTNRFIQLHISRKPAPCSVGAANGKRLQVRDAHDDTDQGATEAEGCSDDPFWCEASVESMLENLWWSTRGRRLWDCAGAAGAPTNTVGQYYRAGYDLKDLVRGTYVDEGHQMTVCVIPKAASTALKKMIRRQTGVATWRAVDRRTRIIGLVKAESSMSVDRFSTMLDSPQWINVATVRDPVERCLSGYLQKIVQLRQFYNIAWKSHRMATFEEYVQVLYRYPEIRSGNQHFVEQSDFCGFRVVHVDFVARVETLREDFEELYRRLGLWEEYGASGWGDDGDQPFLGAFEKSQNHPERLESSAGDAAVASYYTPDTLELVYKMYRGDFDRFGYSIEKWRELVGRSGA